MNIGLCKNESCEKKDICYRFQEQQGEVMEFKNICNENNNYKWLWKTDSNLTEVKDE